MLLKFRTPSGLVHVAALLLGGSLALAGFVVPAPARAQTFVIAAGDGSGIADCLVNGSSCGRIVADAWCEAHGLARATAFGPAEDVTGAIAIEAKVSEPVAKGSLVVTCEP